MAVEIFFKSFVEAGNVRPVPPFGALVGQYGLNTRKVCDYVNELTQIYLDAIPLPVRVFCSSSYPDGYRVELPPPTLGFLFSALFFDEDLEFSFLSEDGVVDIVDLYGLVQVYSFFHSYSLSRSAKIVLAYLSSFNHSIKVINIFENEV